MALTFLTPSAHFQRLGRLARPEKPSGPKDRNSGSRGERPCRRDPRRLPLGRERNRWRWGRPALSGRPPRRQSAVARRRPCRNRLETSGRRQRVQRRRRKQQRPQWTIFSWPSPLMLGVQLLAEWTRSGKIVIFRPPSSGGSWTVGSAPPKSRR